MTDDEKHETLQSFHPPKTQKVFWIEAGIELLHKGSIEYVAVSQLCEETQKTEKSFYDSFESLEHFLQMMLDHWYEQETLSFVAAVEAIGGRSQGLLIKSAKSCQKL